jgi:hypothetical protein
LIDCNVHAYQKVLIELKSKNDETRHVHLQSNIGKEYPCSISCEHLKATLEIVAFKQMSQQKEEQTHKKMHKK